LQTKRRPDAGGIQGGENIKFYSSLIQNNETGGSPFTGKRASDLRRHTQAPLSFAPLANRNSSRYILPTIPQTVDNLALLCSWRQRMFTANVPTATVLTTVSTVIGIVGGLLGLFTFVDTYVLRFKPKFVIGDRLYLTYEQNPKHTSFSHLASLVIQFEIFNHRNKLGRVEDIFFQIYDSQEIEPKILNLFPIAFIADMPTERAEVLNVKRTPPGPIAINNKTSKTLVIEMGQEKNFNQNVDPNGHLKIRAFYKSSNGRWVKFKTLSVYAVFEEKTALGLTTIYNFDLIDKYTEREKLKKRTFRRKLTSYTGVSNFKIHTWIRLLYWKLKTLTLSAVLLCAFPLRMMAACLRAVISEIVAWYLIKRYGSVDRKMRVTVGNADDGKKTEDLIKRLNELIKHKAALVNATSNPNHAVKVEFVANEILVSKTNVTLKIYKGGDGFVYVLKKLTNAPVWQTIFSIKLNKYPFKLSLWASDGRAVLPSTIATMVIDFVALHF
jgi:hypothetical protein